MAWEFESPPGHQLERMSFDSNAEALFLYLFRRVMGLTAKQPDC